MSSIPQVSCAMETVLQSRASELERQVGFVQRSTAQLDGSIFVQMCVLTWMSLPQASYSHLQHSAASLGVHVSNQAIEQRFTPAAVRLMHTVLQEAVGTLISSTAQVPELLGRFHGVYLQDGTLIGLPSTLATCYAGSGGLGAEAGMRLQVRLELGRGRLEGLWMQQANEAERSGAAWEAPLPQDSLFIGDTGYFTLANMRERSAAGQCWLTQAKASVRLLDERGQQWSLLEYLRAQLGEEVDVAVRLGRREQVAVRLIAVRVSPEQAKQRRKRANARVTHPAKGSVARRAGHRPPKPTKPRKRKKVSAARLRLADWTILVTNVPTEKLSVAEAVLLMRVRWQIELLWKLWKQHGQVDTWRSEKPERILTEMYAKLIGLLITHWLTLLGCWQNPDRSLVKAKQVVAWMSPVMAVALSGMLPLPEVLERIAQMMGSGCRLDTRQKRPSTAQLLRQSKLNSS